MKPDPNPKELKTPTPLDDAVKLLNAHFEAFFTAKPFADATKHPVPADNRAWSQVLVSTLTGIDGRGRKKGSDFKDGSDVKAACVWSAIDTPRFNGCIPAGRKSAKSKKANDVTALDETPYIFFVLWDNDSKGRARCRVWAVRADTDPVFRDVCGRWYAGRDSGVIGSDNFQLHPPRNRDDDKFTNTCGDLFYPLLFSAVREGETYKVETWDPLVLSQGQCAPA